jgi:Ca-activated chloride channel homolog
MPTFDPDDPRLTAYALGELDASEVPAVEAQLARCADSRRAVEEVRVTARLLAESLQAEPSPGLGPEHHRAIEGRLRRPATGPILLTLAGLAAAAAALLALVLPSMRSAPQKGPLLLARAADAEAKSGANRAKLQDGLAPPQAAAPAPGAFNEPVADLALRDGGAQGPPTADRLSPSPPVTHFFKDYAAPDASGPGQPGKPPAAGFGEMGGMGMGGGMAGRGETPTHSLPFRPDGQKVATGLDAGGIVAQAESAPAGRALTPAERRRDLPPLLDQLATAPAAPAMTPPPAAAARPEAESLARRAGGSLGDVYRRPADAKDRPARSATPPPSREPGATFQDGSSMTAAASRPPAGGNAPARSFAPKQVQQGRGPRGGLEAPAQSQQDPQGQPGGPRAAVTYGMMAGRQNGQESRQAQRGLSQGQPGEARGRQADPAVGGGTAELAAKLGKKSDRAKQVGEPALAIAGPRRAGESVLEQKEQLPARKPSMEAEAYQLRLSQEALGRKSRRELNEVEGQTKIAKLQDGADRAEAAKPAAIAPPEADRLNEEFAPVVDNPFIPTAQDQRSTFSIDVDTASYANVRRYLVQGGRPPKDAVRIEELINYFPYDYPPPTGDDPFSIHIEVARCPWSGEHRLARIGLKGKEVAPDKRPQANLVFLLDVSGSMAAPNKLPLVKDAMRMLVGRMTEDDRVAIVVYAGKSGLALPSTNGTQKGEILSAIDQLQAGGSTHGSEGIQQAYAVATSGANFVKGGTNRVILCTDGDFNVGITDDAELEKFIADKRQSGVFLSVLGFGEGNLKDKKMEALADKGNGNYHYIDTAQEARKVLVEELSGTLVTIAKDVKVQVEFNPARVESFRLIGYENRVLAHRDFDDDKKDAGEIGAGHTVTALYEVVPTARPAAVAADTGLKYRRRVAADEGPDSKELLTVSLRSKAPDGDASKKVERAVTDEGKDYAAASADFKFAAAVAAFGMILRDSPYRGSATLAGVLELAEPNLGKDPSGYRREFLDLARRARAIWGE